MSRATPRAVQIRDAVVAHLNLIGKDPSTEWFSDQCMVFQKGLVRVQMLGATQRPTLGCRVTQIALGDMGPGYATDHRKGEVLIVGIVTDPLDRERRAYELESDILAALNTDKDLGGVLSDGRIFWKQTQFFEGTDDETGGVDVSFEFEVFSDIAAP